jgi:broad specificity polyphosphatase/5'/3'-nucleotidase SurE
VKTLHRPLRVWPAQRADGQQAWRPTAHLGLRCSGDAGLLDAPVDLVVSGINPNANPATMSPKRDGHAAMDMAISGLPAWRCPNSEYDKRALDDRPPGQLPSWPRPDGLPLPCGTFLNINIRTCHAEIAASRSPARVCAYRDAWCGAAIRAIALLLIGGRCRPISDPAPISGRCRRLHSVPSSGPDCTSC